MINTKLHPISHRLQVVADYWSNLHFWQGISVFHTLIVVNPYMHNHEI